MAIEKYIIDISDLTKLLRGEDLAIRPIGNIKGFCVEITGNVTNGDMIKAMFPDIRIVDVGGLDGLECVAVNIGLGISYFALDWWLTTYKKEIKA